MELTPQQDRQSEIEALLLRLSSGDESAMEPLYTAIRPGVYAYALSLTRSIQDAEDVLHDAFLRICEAAGRYRPNGRPLPWVLTIARNLALSRLREHGRADMLPYEDWEKLTARLPRVTAEDRLVLYAALYRLTAAERQIVVLSVIEGYTTREIAAIVGSPQGTISSKLFRAFKKMRTYLEGGKQR